MAAMIENMAIGLKYAAWAAKSRGERDESGEIVAKPADAIPGSTWLKSFFRRHNTKIKTGHPKSKGVLREQWRTKDKFLYWYRLMEIKFLHYGFCKINPIYKGEDPDSDATLAKVYPTDQPLMLWEDGMTDRVIVLDKVGGDIGMVGMSDKGKSEVRCCPWSLAGPRTNRPRQRATGT